MDLRLIVEGLDKSNSEGTVKLSPNLTPLTRVDMNLNKNSCDDVASEKHEPLISLETPSGSLESSNTTGEKPLIVCKEPNSLPDRYSHPKHSNPPSIVKSTKRKRAKSTDSFVRDPSVSTLPSQQLSFQSSMRTGSQHELLPQTVHPAVSSISAPVPPFTSSIYHHNNNSNGYLGEYSHPYNMTIYPSPPQAPAQPHLQMYPMGYPVAHPAQCVFPLPTILPPQSFPPQQVPLPLLSSGIQPPSVQTAPGQPIPAFQLSQQASHLSLQKGTSTSSFATKPKIDIPRCNSIVSSTSSDNKVHSLPQHQSLVPPPVLPVCDNKYHSESHQTEHILSTPIEQNTHFTQRPWDSSSPPSVECVSVCPSISSTSSNDSSSASSSSLQSSPGSSPTEKQLKVEHASSNSKFWRFVDESKRDSSRPVVSANSLKEYIKILDSDSGNELDESMSWSPNKLKYACKECGRSFFRKSDLVRHIQIHLGIKPNVCTICGKQFIQRSALTVHLRVHTGEKPFGCQKCGRSFSDSSSLARHRRIHQRNAQEAAKRMKPQLQAPLVEDAIM